MVEGARPIAYVLFVMVGLSLALSWLSQRSIVVDAGGVRLPLRRKILWRDVERVSEPGRFDPVVTVVLQDGRTRPTGLPPEYAAEVAKIGHVPFGSV